MILRNFFKNKKEKTGDELINEEEKLGVATDGIFPKEGLHIRGFNEPPREAALQERVRRAKEIRYSKLTWIIALVSAIASALSALVAWFAVFSK